MPSGIRNWFDDLVEVSSDDPKLGAMLGAYYVYVGFWLTLSTRARFGTHVYDRDWDALVVLDTCRVDAMEAVADEYDFIEDVSSITSLGSTSDEWMSQTFDTDHVGEVRETAYVTGNPYTKNVLHEGVYPPSMRAPPLTWPAWDVVDARDFARLDEVWEDGTDEDLGVVPPRTLTDRTIRAGRETDADRIVAHYMQPHIPWVADHVDAETTPSDEEAAPFDAMRAGDLSRDDAWEHYLDNLRLVLDDVELLLENLDAETVVITADHGEGFGEFGMYEHPVGCPLPAIKRVPWVETSATDEETHDPATDAERETSGSIDRDVEEHLADLGYR